MLHSAAGSGQHAARWPIRRGPALLRSRSHAARCVRPRAASSRHGNGTAAAYTTPHSGYHWDGTDRRFFEGWYWKVGACVDTQACPLQPVVVAELQVQRALGSRCPAQVTDPDSGDSFALIYSIEDPGKADTPGDRSGRPAVVQLPNPLEVRPLFARLSATPGSRPAPAPSVPWHHTAALCTVSPCS
jgi:hypothetical protein